jgi:predicted lipid-binding transport protein (Tim44 family)
MRTTGWLLAGALCCLLVGGVLSAVVGPATGGWLALPGLLLLVAAIGSSYMDDIREGYRSVRGE